MKDSPILTIIAGANRGTLSFSETSHPNVRHSERSEEPPHFAFVVARFLRGRSEPVHYNQLHLTSSRIANRIMQEAHVHVISRKKLLEAATAHGDLYAPIDVWYRIAKKAGGIRSMMFGASFLRRME